MFAGAVKDGILQPSFPTTTGCEGKRAGHKCFECRPQISNQKLLFGPL
jgi:hypothetical protein